MAAASQQFHPAARHPLTRERLPAELARRTGHLVGPPVGITQDPVLGLVEVGVELGLLALEVGRDLRERSIWPLYSSLSASVRSVYCCWLNAPLPAWEKPS